MILYNIYLETCSDHCMAHVLSLPGCMVRASNPEEVVSRLPGAIREYHAWLRQHSESVHYETEPIEVAIAEESTGFGPFNPGDAAALFSPDREPITPEEIRDHFRLMGYARADLLALVSGLPDETLDWQPDPQSFSIRRILRHIGNAEEWYVSRIVPPETLPAEWEHDEDLPIFDFLEMERRTAMTRLCKLTGEERAAITHPAHWTQHPDEPWTVRKSLRRFLEHEREHTAQIREILEHYEETHH